MKAYRLRPSEAGLRELARRVFGVEVKGPARFLEWQNGEGALTWRVGGTEHALYLGACRGQAILSCEWMERDKLGFRRHCCDAERVQVAVLLELEMLEEVEL